MPVIFENLPWEENTDSQETSNVYESSVSTGSYSCFQNQYRGWSREKNSPPRICVEALPVSATLSPKRSSPRTLSPPSPSSNKRFNESFELQAPPPKRLEMIQSGFDDSFLLGYDDEDDEDLCMDRDTEYLNQLELMTGEIKKNIKFNFNFSDY